MFSKIKAFYEKSERFFHPLVGLSSYDKYLEHMQRNHPDKQVQSRGDFFKSIESCKIILIKIFYITKIKLVVFL